MHVFRWAGMNAGTASTKPHAEAKREDTPSPLVGFLVGEGALPCRRCEPWRGSVQPLGISQHRRTWAWKASISSLVTVVSLPLSAKPTASKGLEASGGRIWTGSIVSAAAGGGAGLAGAGGPSFSGFAGA